MFFGFLLVSTLLCTLVAGFVFTYAIVVMPGFGKLNNREFIQAFQATDGIIQNNQPLFMFVWVGSIASVAIIAKHDIVLAIVGGLFVLETVSVIIQVVSFKLTGKRVFMMAPIHHHFEKKGWAESTVVIRFWIIAIILAYLG